MTQGADRAFSRRDRFDSAARQRRTTRSNLTLVLIGIAIVSGAGSLLFGQELRLIALFALALGLTVRLPLKLLIMYVVPALAYIALWLAFGYCRSIADDTPWAASTLNWVPRLETWLFGRLPSVSLQNHWYVADDRQWYDYTFAVVYYTFFFVPMLIALVMIFRHRMACWFNFWTLVVMEGAAVVLHFAIPTAPPWIASSAVIRVKDGGGASAELATSAPGGALANIDPNQFAAMPSVHLGVTCALAVTAWRYGRNSYRVASLLYCGMMAICLVYFGEHYVLDEVAGVLLAVAGGIAARRIMSSSFKLSLPSRHLRVLTPQTPRSRLAAPSGIVQHADPAD